MKNYKITDKATKSIIGVVAMTPAQARRAEKDFIVKEAQPKRSDLGASAVGWSPGYDDGRPITKERLKGGKYEKSKRIKRKVYEHYQNGSLAE